MPQTHFASCSSTTADGWCWVDDMRARMLSVFALLIMLLVTPITSLMAVDVTICRDPSVQHSLFATAEIKAACTKVGNPVTEAALSAANNTGVTGVRVILARKGDAITGWSPLPNPTVPQAYGIRVRTSGSLQEILVYGFDATGAMYGGLDVAEAVMMGMLSSMSASDKAPYVSERGIKLNIPLDARTPSYSDPGDPAQAAIPEIWSISFWQEYLDEMARQRLTTLSLWNLHPFPSMVTVPEYPAVALSDVKRTLVPFTEVALRGQGAWDAATMGKSADLEVVKVMTPTEKTTFWNQVIEMADARGISVYIFTWNIYTDGLEGNPYGIVEDSADSSVKQASATTKKYFRASVRTLLTKFPKLAGLGITGGEEMDGDAAAKEKWLADTYGEGMNDIIVGYEAIAPNGTKTVVPANPTRKMRLIHRLHEVTYSQINTAFGKFKNSFTIDTSHKYSVAHTFSTTKPTFKLKDINSAPAEDQVWLTVRFDDQYNARWGDPDFVRSWVNNLPQGINGQGEPKLKGFYMGPDGYTWARRTNLKDSSINELDIRRWWYTQSLFSRLSYDPTLTNTFFNNLVAARMGVSLSTATAINNGLASASKITPWLLRYHWDGGNDYMYFPEGCKSLYGGFISVNDYMDNSPIGSGDGNGQSPLTMTNFCNEEIKGNKPLDISVEIDKAAADALSAIASVPNDASNTELMHTLADIRILAAMGKYYAAKFRGTRDLKYAAIYKATASKSAEYRAKSVAHLTDALALWTAYADLSQTYYYPTRMSRIGSFDLKAYTVYAAYDIAIANNQTSGGPTTPTDPVLVSQNGATAVLKVRGQSSSEPESQLKYFWYLDGTRPAGVTYSNNGNNAARDVTVTFTKPGRYLFRALILDSKNRYDESNDLEVRYVASTTNQPPTVSAGLDASVTLPATANLVGTASDDGLPAPATLTTTWSKVSGPGTVTFGNANAKITTAAFSVDGAYTLRLTASDGAFSPSDDIIVTVNPANNNNNVTPTPTTGPQANNATSSTPTLTGTATPGAIIKIYDGTTLIGQTTADGNGNWTFTVTPALAAGAHQLSFTVTEPNKAESGKSPAVTITVSGTTNQPIKINFQPATAPGVIGYEIDSGELFGARANNKFFGWDVNLTADTRDRNNSLSNGDQRLDTLILTQKDVSVKPKWEIQLANGIYDVTLVAGDPDYYNAATATTNLITYDFKIESVGLNSQKPTQSNRWATFSVPAVSVQDGRLTITHGSAANRTRVCYVEINPQNSASN
jgi:Bacterial Ig-like domain